MDQDSFDRSTHQIIANEKPSGKKTEGPFYWIRKRDGRVVEFDLDKISEAIFKAVKAVGGDDHDLAVELSEVVVRYLVEYSKESIPNVEEVQDAVEKVLIERGHAKTAKAYILYRDHRTRMREPVPN